MSVSEDRPTQCRSQILQTQALQARVQARAQVPAVEEGVVAVVVVVVVVAEVVRESALECAWAEVQAVLLASELVETCC